MTSKAFSAAFQRLDQRCRPCPGGVKTHDRQIDAFEHGLLGGEVSASVHRPADACVDALDGVGRADDGAYLAVELQEGHEFGPGVAPRNDLRPHGPIAILPLAVLLRPSSTAFFDMAAANSLSRGGSGSPLRPMVKIGYGLLLRLGLLGRGLLAASDRGGDINQRS